MELRDLRVELRRERRQLRHAMGSRRHDHVLGPKRLEAGLDHVALAVDVVKSHDGIDACQYPTVKTIATLASSCPPLLAGPLPVADAEQLARALKVIADPARLRLLSLIQAQPDGEACVCHLTEPLGLSQPTVSHHLKVLLDAGLVEREQRGSWAYFRVAPDQLRLLCELLA
jgi:ArsR family transcriptional regulator